MDLFLNAFKALIGAGAYVMLPIIITILGLIFRLKLSKAFQCGITITCGFVGINLLVNLLKSAVTPAASAMVTNLGLQLDVTDVGWGAISSVTWASPIVTFRVALVVALCRGNVFRSILISIPVMAAILYAGTWAAPMMTALAQSTGLTFDGQIASMAGPSLTQTFIVVWTAVSQYSCILVPALVVIFGLVWWLIEGKIGMDKIEAYAAKCDEEE